VRFAFMLAEKAFFPVAFMCRHLAVSRGGFYSWCKRPECKRAKQNRQLAARIKQVHEESRGTYGSPRVHAELAAEGTPAGRHRVAKLMRQEGIRARRKRRFVKTTDSKHNLPIAPNLVQRDFSPAEPNRLWVADITYIWTREGWLYLAVVVDLFSRYVVGWALSGTIDRHLALAALGQATDTRRPTGNLVHHSDRGCQYASADYRAALAAHGITCSMSKKGDPWDNAAAESFFSSFKTELVHHVDFLSRAAARRSVFDYIEVFYNRRRRHSTLGYVSPAEYEREAVSEALAA
jgi:transposase InsO family protein